ncbi:MAG: ATP-dependent Clp protease ATP-binding subunit [Gemmataceae bacterium]|nr:ATP-dependent Clp protease ATP-binding subunit [Gemmataceae bacterium]
MLGIVARGDVARGSRPGGRFRPGTIFAPNPLRRCGVWWNVSHCAGSIITRGLGHPGMAAEIVFPIGLVHRKVGPGAVLTEPLFFPELARLAATRALAGESARRTLADLVVGLPPGDLMRRRGVARPAGGTGGARPHTFDLVIPPPRTNEAWREPVTLRFHAVVWDHPPGPADPAGAGLVLARVAELGIEVIADPKDDLDTVLRREALSALRRLNLSTGLKPLAGVQTTSGFRVEWVDVTTPIPTLKERAARAETGDGGEKKSVLRKVATALTPDRLDPAFEVDEVVRQVAESLTAKPPQSVLLIGPSGVGKTAAVRELVRRRGEFHLGATPFFQTSGARLVAGQTGFGMWEQRCQEVIKEAAKKRAVLHVGPLVELMEVGKNECNHSGIATFLRPAVARGDLLCVAECTPEQIPLIEKQDPQLLDTFRHVAVEEPDVARGKMILSRFAATVVPAGARVPPDASRKELMRARRRARRPATRGLKDRPLDPAALAAIDRLHRRYATYSAYPGRPLRFLENLIRDGADGTPITEPEVYAGFTRETGLPRALVDPAVPLDLAETRSWFAARVVGQPDAVDLVVSLLATVKAGLTRPNRPIASLLFIGPTGVGKTEMAKALAEFLFGSRDRLTRFDMSEYADPVAVRRLVGGAFGSEGLLTAKVREQPFSVLLLDEVEKADPSVFDLLLQALGEARLTDAGGRLADFRNTVVILTSNLGAEAYQTGSTGFAGGPPTAAEAREHFGRAVEQFLRPEMFNRLDRIVSFAPLGAGTIRRIADREWHKVLGRDGVRFRGLTVGTSPALLDHLAAVGFDPRYGARPLKRAMERELLAPLARQLNRHGGDVPLSAEVGVSDGRPAVTVRPIPGAKPRSFREPTDPVGALAAAVQHLRRWHQLAETSSVVRELANDVYQLGLVEQRVFKKQARKKPLSRFDQETLARLGRLREVADEVRRQREAVFALEDEAVIAFHAGAGPPPADLARQLADANRDWDRLLLKLYGLSGGPQAVTLAVFSEHRGHLGEFAAAYHELARRGKLSVDVCRYALPGTEADPGPPPRPVVPPPRPPAPLRTPMPRAGRADPEPAADLPETVWSQDRLYLMTAGPPKELLRRVMMPPGAPLAPLPAGTVGVGLAIGGTGAHVRFGGEAGLHKIVVAEATDGASPDALVVATPEPLVQYRPPEAIVRRGAIKADRPRRVYDLGKGEVDDLELEEMWTNLWGELPDRLAPLIDANARARLIQLIVE